MKGELFLWNQSLILMAKKPKYFILENVSGIKSIDKGRTLKDMLNSKRFKVQCGQYGL